MGASLDPVALRAAALSLLRAPTDVRSMLPVLSHVCVLSNDATKIHAVSCSALSHPHHHLPLSEALTCLSEATEWCHTCTLSPANEEFFLDVLSSASLADALALAATFEANPTLPLLAMLVRARSAARHTYLRTTPSTPPVDRVVERLDSVLVSSAPVLLPGFLERVAATYLRREASTQDDIALALYVRSEGSSTLRNDSTAPRVCASFGVPVAALPSFLTRLDSFITSSPVVLAVGYRSPSVTYSDGFIEQLLALVAPHRGVVSVAIPEFAARFLAEHDHLLSVIPSPEGSDPYGTASVLGALLSTLASPDISVESVMKALPEALEAATALSV